MEEIWKPVLLEGIEAGWQVSNIGRVMNSRGGISFGNMTNEYYAVSIKGRPLRVHRLVAEAFCPKREGCYFVDHLDMVKTNNRFDNLEWVTHAENMQRAHKMKKFREPRKTSIREIHHIFHLKSQGYNHTQIAGITGIDRTVVYKIANGTIWSGITGMGYKGDTTLEKFV
jgi:hypothetical protein